jgi:predicted Zn-dependent protease
VGELQRSGAKMLEAAQKLYELNPANPAVLNNYAAALITVRQRPDEAVRLTLQFLGRNPNSSGAIINHCLALLQNLRTEEAEALLQKVDRSRIDPAEITAYDLVQLEIQYNKREFAAASKVAERIDPKNLFAEERQWLEMVKKQFPAKP